MVSNVPRSNSTRTTYIEGQRHSYARPIWQDNEPTSLDIEFEKVTNAVIEARGEVHTRKNPPNHRVLSRRCRRRLDFDGGFQRLWASHDQCLTAYTLHHLRCV